MSLYLLDTDILSDYQRGNPAVVSNVARHTADELAISVITVEEQVGGWYTALRKEKGEENLAQVYLRMAQTIESLASWTVLPYPVAAMRRHADLKRQKLNVRTNDLKIAAIALHFNAIIVTKNEQDFKRVLGVNLENWAS